MANKKKKAASKKGAADSDQQLETHVATAEAQDTAAAVLAQMDIDFPLSVKLPAAVHVDGPKSTAKTEFVVEAVKLGHLEDAVNGLRTVGDMLLVGARAAGIKGDVRGKIGKLPISAVSPFVACGAWALVAYEAARQQCAEELQREGFDSDKPYKLELRDGTSLGDDEIREIRISPPTVDQLWDVTSGGLSMHPMCQLGGQLAGVSSVSIDGLSMHDAGRLAAVTAVFIEASPAT